MHPIHAPRALRRRGGTTSAIGFPKRVINMDRRDRFIRRMTEKQVALNFETEIVSIIGS